MKRYKLSLAVLAVGVTLTGCVNPNGTPNNTGTGALTGGAVGAASGAMIGGASGNAGAGAAIGAGIGAITGALIGNSMDQQQRERLHSQAPRTYVKVQQGQPLGLTDIKNMAQAGVSDDVIISQIRNTHTVYHLSAADIIDLSRSGVSQKVVNFMINTPKTVANSTPVPAPAEPIVSAPPPPPPAQPVVVSPGQGYVWVGGSWQWHGGWVWVGGRWVLAPYSNAVWVSGAWRRGSHGWKWHHGYWK